MNAMQPETREMERRYHSLQEFEARYLPSSHADTQAAIQEDDAETLGENLARESLSQLANRCDIAGSRSLRGRVPASVEETK